MERHSYPVSYEIASPERYNRWTVAFRPILAIPQLILVGGRGVLTVALGMLVFFAWFAILFTGRFPKTMRDFCVFLYRWTQNVNAYITLQAAPYPPFGSGAYPLELAVVPAERYNRWSVAFRIILVIPHFFALLLLGLAQALVTLVAWFAILFTGRYPEGMYGFSVAVSRWFARVEAYLYLFVDEYPPFTLGAQAGGYGLPAGQPA